MIIIIHLARVILNDGETIDMAIIEIIMIINDHQNHDDDHHIQYPQKIRKNVTPTHFTIINRSS